MQTLQDLKRSIESAQDLHGVVRTMKTLAAVNIRQYERAVESLSDYYRAVELGLRAVLLRGESLVRTEMPDQTLVLVFGSDQGMAGRFNEIVADFAIRTVAEERIDHDATTFWAVGMRAANAIQDRFGGPEKTFPLPSSVDFIADSVQEIVLRFERHRHERGESRLLLCSNAPSSGTTYSQRRMFLLPPDREWLEEIERKPWSAKGLPLFTLAREELFSTLIREYLFVSLFRSFASSLAAENAARLAAMQRAESNIQERKDDLSARYHSARQSLITEELLDVISGFEALKEDDSN